MALVIRPSSPGAAEGHHSLAAQPRLDPSDLNPALGRFRQFAILLDLVMAGEILLDLVHLTAFFV